MECFTVYADEIENRIDPYFYRPEFRELKNKLEKLKNQKLGLVTEFSSETWNQKDFFDSEFPYIEISEIDIETGEIQNITYFEKSRAPSRAKMIVRENDIIVSTTRPHRGAISLIDKEKDGFIASTGFAILRKIKLDNVKREYLLFFLRTQLSLKQMLQRSSGGNYPAITSEELKNIIIPIPSLETQNKIIELMRKTYQKQKEGEAKAQQLLTSINDYVLDELGIKLPELKDRMTYVVSSDGVENNRCDAYYYQPKFEEVEKAIGKGKFEVKDLKDSFEDNLVKGILPNEEEKEGDLNVLQIKNILRNGLIDTSDLVTAKNIFRKEHKINDEEVVIVITGATIGKVGLWNKKEEVYLGGDMVKFKANENSNPYYIQAFLLSQLGQYQIKREITGATNGHLSPSDVELIKIPLPPLAVQNKIAEEVKKRMQKAEQLQKEAKEELEKAKQEVEKIVLGE